MGGGLTKGEFFPFFISISSISDATHIFSVFALFQQERSATPRNNADGDATLEKRRTWLW